MEGNWDSVNTNGGQKAIIVGIIIQASAKTKEDK